MVLAVGPIRARSCRCPRPRGMLPPAVRLHLPPQAQWEHQCCSGRSCGAAARSGRCRASFGTWAARIPCQIPPDGASHAGMRSSSAIPADSHSRSGATSTPKRSTRSRISKPTTRASRSTRSAIWPSRTRSPGRTRSRRCAWGGGSGATLPARCRTTRSSAPAWRRSITYATGRTILAPRWIWSAAGSRRIRLKLATNCQTLPPPGGPTSHGRPSSICAWTTCGRTSTATRS